MLEYLFNHKPRRVLIDELDKLSTKDQTSLLNLIETGIISETKYKKTRSMKIKTAVFATSNNLERIIAPLQSRFFIVKLEPYSYEQFYKITVNLLTRQSSMEIKMAEAIAKTVWSTSKNIRDCVRIGKMADSFDDVNWIVGTFL
jgi:holliday junction DNA helicase RuvB